MVNLWDYSAVSCAEIFILNIEIAGSIEQQPSKLWAVGAHKKSEVAPTLNVFTTDKIVIVEVTAPINSVYLICQR